MTQQAALRTARPTPPRQHRRSPWVAVLLLTGLAITLAGIFPFRQMIAQQRQVDASQQRLDAIVEQNAELEAEITALSSDAEVERMARERGLVRPGETGFAIQFDDNAVRPAPAVEPDVVDRGGRSLLGQIWDFLTGRDLDPDG